MYRLNYNSPCVGLVQILSKPCLNQPMKWQISDSIGHFNLIYTLLIFCIIQW